MFKKNIDSENSRFSMIYQAAEIKLKKEGPVVPFTLGPEAVTKKVIHALESANPKARYYVTFPTYLFAVLKRILPIGTLDYLLAKSSRIERS